MAQKKDAGRLDAALDKARQIGERQEKEKPAQHGEKGHVSFRLPKEIIEKIRAAAFWTGERTGEIAARALAAEVERLERKRGSPFPRPGREE